MRNCIFLNRNFNHALFGSVGGFTDRLTHFIGFSEANTNFSFVVTTHDQSTEAETTPTLDDFGTTINEDNFFSSLLRFPWGFGTGLFFFS